MTPADVVVELYGVDVLVEIGEYDGEIVPMAVPTPQVLEDLTGTVLGGASPTNLSFGAPTATQQLVVMSMVMSAASGSNREEFQLIAIDQNNSERIAARWYIGQGTIFNLQSATGPIRLRAGERARLQSVTVSGAIAWAFNLLFGYV